MKLQRPGPGRCDGCSRQEQQRRYCLCSKRRRVVVRKRQGAGDWLDSGQGGFTTHCTIDACLFLVNHPTKPRLRALVCDATVLVLLTTHYAVAGLLGVVPLAHTQTTDTDTQTHSHTHTPLRLLPVAITANRPSPSLRLCPPPAAASLSSPCAPTLGCGAPRFSRSLPLPPTPAPPIGAKHTTTCKRVVEKKLGRGSATRSLKEWKQWLH